MVEDGQTGHVDRNCDTGVRGRAGRVGMEEWGRQAWRGGRGVGRNYFRLLYMCQIMGGSTGGGQVVRPIRFGAYNIRNCGNGGLESTLRGISQANVDLGIFQ